MGAIYTRQSYSGFYLSHDVMATACCSKGSWNDGIKLRRAYIPSEHEYAEMYYKKTGRSKIENWDFYMAYNIFRLAGIAQGIVGRVRDGTASSSEAKNYESFVPILGKLGWNIVEEAAK